MDRRESIKTLLLGSIGTGLLLNGCSFSESDHRKLQDVYDFSSYGRTPEEAAHDKKLFSENFFTNHEIESVAILCDLILPASNAAGSAGDAYVPEFIDFIVKEMPNHQEPLRNGIKWLDAHSKEKFGGDFISLTATQQTEILDEIAYPDKAAEELKEGVDFFTLMRNLTLTGYYTTEMGFKDLGYKGNTPNNWDGVPDEIMAEHGLSYERDWPYNFVNPDNRADVAEWDDEGNLLNN